MQHSEHAVKDICVCVCGGGGGGGFPKPLVLVVCFKISGWRSQFTCFLFIVLEMGGNICGGKQTARRTVLTHKHTLMFSCTQGHIFASHYHTGSKVLHDVQLHSRKQ